MKRKDPWADFWAAGGLGPESGCLPKGLHRIDAVQRRVWQEASRQLAARARVLDLATGDGAVLGKIAAARRDLVLTGIDSAEQLPPGPKGASLRGGVSMEELPFDDAVFELVTSQFGIEYGDVAKIAPEVARVLGRKGCFHFIVHHAEGPIVAHNVGRLAGLRWAAFESKLLEKARAVVRARSITALPTPGYFRAAPAEGRARFPVQGVAEEFAMAVLQTLELGRNWPPQESLEVLDTLEAKASNEVGRIEALCRAALAPDDMRKFLDRLKAAGLWPDEPQLLFEEGSEIPFAWHVKGRRAKV